MATLALYNLKKIKYGQLNLDGDDPMAAIQNRIEELQTMVKPRAEFANFINKLSPEQKERIMKIASMDVQALRDQKRKKWDAKDKFRHAFCILCIIIRACRPRRRYYKEDKPDTAISIKRLRKKDQSKSKGPNRSRSSLSLDMELALLMYSDYRTEDDIKKVIWVLRATKAFKHLFPADSEKELAKVVAYERYDSNRIIACQGREPERFYFVLTGKVQKVREYKLSSGHISRSEGYIEKGTSTDPEELEMCWQREHHFVARGQTEVLIIHRDDFMRLQNKSQGPPVDFISKLELFHEFPCEVFHENPDSIQLKYYAQDAIVSKDTNRTPWLHIVKSGKVRVVRIQYVTDVENESRFTKKTTEELGCGRAFSHANAMLGSLVSQRKMKALNNNNISLPELTRRHKPYTSLQASTFDISENDQERGEELDTFDETTKSKSHKRRAKLVKTPIIAEPGTDNPSRSASRMDIPNDHQSSSEDDNVNQESEQKINGRPRIEKRSITLPPITPIENDSSELHPHGTYMTREMTEFDPVYARRMSAIQSVTPRQKREAPQRKACIQLDLLQPGDIFGLDDISRKFRSLQPSRKQEGLEHLEKPLASEGQGVSLVSDGAEVIRISKRFFLQHAQNNTMLRVETMQREYMSPDEAKEVLYTKETWNQYKSVLMRRLLDSLQTRS